MEVSYYIIGGGGFFSGVGGLGGGGFLGDSSGMGGEGMGGFGNSGPEGSGRPSGGGSDAVVLEIRGEPRDFTVRKEANIFMEVVDIDAQLCALSLGLIKYGPDLCRKLTRVHHDLYLTDNAQLNLHWNTN